MKAGGVLLLAALAGGAAAQGVTHERAHEGTHEATQGTAQGAAPGDAPGAPGDPARGRAIVADRQLGLCLLCHPGPIAEAPAQGDLAPDLRGAGRRWTVDQLRQRLVDPRRLNPATLMPAYGADGSAGTLWRVAPAFRGRPLLSPQQIDDVVAYLATLRD